MMYKISNQLVDIDSPCHFTVAQSNTRGHSARILQPSCNSVVYANSFFPQRTGQLKKETRSFLKRSVTRTRYQKTLFITELWTLSRARPT